MYVVQIVDVNNGATEKVLDDIIVAITWFKAFACCKDADIVIMTDNETGEIINAWFRGYGLTIINGMQVV